MPSRANWEAQLGHSKPLTDGRASGICFRLSPTGVPRSVLGDAVDRAMSDKKEQRLRRVSWYVFLNWDAQMCVDSLGACR
jgi:hypothetical protein